MNPAHRTARSLTRRARQRGTALMEALMVIMVMVVLLSGAIYFQTVYSAKIRSNQNARAYAFTYALHGCNAGDTEAVSDESLAIEPNAGVPSGENEADSDAKSDLADSDHAVPGTKLDGNPAYTNAFSQNSVGSVNARSTAQLGAFSALGIGAKAMVSSTHMQCNPQPKDGTQLLEVGIQGAKSFANW
jgi:Tfp pilus assembly protein PilX